MVSVASLNAASRKTEVSKPSRRTAKHAIPTSAHIDPVSSAPAACDVQLAAQVARVVRHPDDHVRDHRDGDQRDDRLEPLLRAVGELVVDDAEHDRDADAQDDGQRHARPHRPEPVGPARAAQEGGDDPDDQRRLEALAQGDDEGGQHARPAAMT